MKIKEIFEEIETRVAKKFHDEEMNKKILNELGIGSDYITTYTDFMNLLKDENKLEEVRRKLKMKVFW